MGTTVSCILIVKDEERNIDACLDSLSWADEIIVVDSGSIDRTAAICAGYPKVVYRDFPWEGFGPQKNRALALATKEWVFSIDADERVTTELANEIISTVRAPRFDAYRIKRKNIYRGAWVRRSGWWPDEVLRLFRRGAARFDDRIVHESVLYNGRTGVLENPLLHHSYNEAGDFISRVDRYSTLGARLLSERGKRAGTLNILARTFFVFLKTYIFKLGFLDGRAGLLVAFSTAEVTFYKYMKLAEIGEGGHQTER
ncbi:MAG: glycosyltransferase family 2 protein [Candidatus Methylomirabilis sp.]|nr:glycosyltransferase family 2 protein [Deltaproteobacteria bacterium]